MMITRVPIALSCLAGLAFVLVLGGGPITVAQAQDEAPKGDKRASLAPALPKTPAERDAILVDLYEQLAVAPDALAAKSVADNIERVWLHSGSPTVDLLFGRA